MKQLLLIFCVFSVLSSGAHASSTPVPPDSLNCDTLWLKSGKIMLVNILSDNGREIKFTACPPNEIVSTIPKSSTKLSPRDSALAAQRASMCDTIYLKSGEIVAGHMKFYNSRKVVYTGCCENCISEKVIKRKDVDSIIYVDGRKIGTDRPVTTATNESVTPTQTSSEPTEKTYTEEEKAGFKKKSRLFGILGLCAIPIALTGALLLVFVTTANPVVFGALFFVGVLIGLAMAMFYLRNRKKAGIQREKKRNKKKD